MAKPSPDKGASMDLFRASVTKHTGKGGWHCPCCNVQSHKHDQQHKNKQRFRQQARQILKRQLHRDLH